MPLPDGQREDCDLMSRAVFAWLDDVVFVGVAETLSWDRVDAASTCWRACCTATAPICCSCSTTAGATAWELSSMMSRRPRERSTTRMRSQRFVRLQRYGGYDDVPIAEWMVRDDPPRVTFV